ARASTAPPPTTNDVYACDSTATSGGGNVWNKRPFEPPAHATLPSFCNAQTWSIDPLRFGWLPTATSMNSPLGPSSSAPQHSTFPSSCKPHVLRPSADNCTKRSSGGSVCPTESSPQHSAWPSKSRPHT